MYLTFALRRLLVAVPLLLGVVAVNFFLIQLAPGDPVTALVGEYPAPQDYIDRVRAEFGLDKPLPQQFIAYLGKLLAGDLGYSFAQRRSVVEVIAAFVWPTALLGLAALLISVVSGVGLGYWAALHRGGIRDRISQSVTILGHSLPDFWIGQVAILVFVVALGWLPFQGMTSFRGPTGGFGIVGDVLWHLVLPAMVLSLRYTATIARITRASLIAVMGEDYIRAVRARGASEHRVRLFHALRNAAPPIVTTIGYDLGFLFAGAVLVEVVFGWPGLGRLLNDALGARDYPVMLGILLLISVTVILVNLLTDLIVAAIDPRTRL